MKHFKNILLSFLLVGLASCTDDDVNYTTSVKPIVSMTGQSANSVVEGETITISLATNMAYKERMDFKLELISGGDDSDYFVSNADGEEIGATSVDDGFGAFGYKISIPAYAETHSFNITARGDVLAESTENLRFKFISTDNGNGIAEGGQFFINLEVINFVSDEFAMVIDWDKTVNYKTIERNIIETELDDETINHTESLCDLVDYDAFLNDFSAFAFTGNCPEDASVWTAPSSGGITTAVLADGTYDLYVDLWDVDLGLNVNPANGVNEILDADFALPFSVQISHTGTFNTTFEVPSLYFSNDEVSGDSNLPFGDGDGEKLVGTIVVSGGKYTVYDRLGELVAAE